SLRVPLSEGPVLSEAEAALCYVRLTETDLLPPVMSSHFIPSISKHSCHSQECTLLFTKEHFPFAFSPLLFLSLSRPLSLSLSLPLSLPLSFLSLPLSLSLSLSLSRTRSLSLSVSPYGSCL